MKISIIRKLKFDEIIFSMSNDQQINQQVILYFIYSI